VDCDRMQDPLERPLSALLADLGRRILDALKDLEYMPFRALVFVDRHAARLATG
jgi:hypothetical protein